MNNFIISQEQAQKILNTLLQFSAKDTLGAIDEIRNLKKYEESKEDTIKEDG